MKPGSKPRRLHAEYEACYTRWATELKPGPLRAEDGELVRLVRADLAALTGVTAEPMETLVTRWGGGLPQYGVGHLDRVRQIERAVAEVAGLAVAGAALHGVGIPACIATAEAAATRITSGLAR